ncbi:MAG: UDP-glucose 4-epimerase GalE [Dongiaceae bacterium]
MTAERILVTGGAGYVGAHVCKALARSGFEPVVLDNLSTGHRSAVRWGRLIELDLADKAALVETLRRERPAGVAHLAASIEVAQSMREPARYYANNVVNSLNLLEAMQAAGVPAIVFSSTGATYGIATQVPIPEDHLQLPVNPYGETKLVIERALGWLGKAQGLRWLAFRYFNAAGADPDAEIGEQHEPEIHLIPLALGAALGHRPPLQVMGLDYPTPDGTAVRDYVHVADLAEAHVVGLRHLLAGGESGAFNLGSGRGTSVREIVDEVATVTGRRPPVRESGRRPGDPPILVADPRRAMRTLGWQPRQSDLRTILETAARWHGGGVR